MLNRLIIVPVVALAAAFVGAAPALASVPVANDDSYYFKVGMNVVVPASDGLLANDLDGAQSVEVVATSALPPGFTLSPDGAFTYNAPDAPTEANFSYCLTDPGDAADGTITCYDSASVNLRVINEPGAVADTYVTQYQQTLIVPAPGVLGNDTTVPPDAKVAWLDPEVLAGNPDGSFTFTPGSATGTKTFRYCIILEIGNPSTCVSNAATVTITIIGGPPVAVDDTYTTLRNMPLTVPAPGVLGNDQNVKPDHKARWQTEQPPGLTLNEDGSINYSPPGGFVGTVSFMYTICLVGGPPICQSNNATVTIQVKSATAVPDTYTVQSGQSLAVPAPGVKSNDLDVPEGLQISWEDTAPDGMAINKDGGFVYTPAAGFLGEVTFNYCIVDARGLCVSDYAQVTVTVTQPSSGGGGLPVTGVNVSMLATAGAALLLAGAVIMLLLRRRATSH